MHTHAQQPNTTQSSKSPKNSSGLIRRLMATPRVTATSSYDLHRTIGNQAGGRLLMAEIDESSAAPLQSDLSTIPVTQSSPVANQPKLTVGRADSPLEREADQVAAQVLNASDASIASATARPKKNIVSADVGLQQLPGSNSLDKGKPLSNSEREFFEPRFGHDFSRVRVHTDSAAAASATAISARAYTVGNHIVFDSGEYSPQTFPGRQLMAHELTHTIQQQGAAPAIQRKEAPSRSDERSAEVFSDPVIAAARDKLESNAGLWNWLLRWVSNSSWGTRDCITTIREIVIPSLYEGSELKEIQRRVAKNAKNNTMPQVMTGMQEAGFASKPKTITFKEEVRVFEKGTHFEHELSKPVNAASKVSDYLESQVSDVQGWHAFGLSLLDGYHSATIFVNVADGKTQFYWADQVRVSSEMHEENSGMGFREYSKDGLDKYLDHYIQSAWDANRSKKLSKVKEQGNDRSQEELAPSIGFPWAVDNMETAVEKEHRPQTVDQIGSQDLRDDKRADSAQEELLVQRAIFMSIQLATYMAGRSSSWFKATQYWEFQTLLNGWLLAR